MTFKRLDRIEQFHESIPDRCFTPNLPRRSIYSNLIGERQNVAWTVPVCVCHRQAYGCLRARHCERALFFWIHLYSIKQQKYVS